MRHLFTAITLSLTAVPAAAQVRSARLSFASWQPPQIHASQPALPAPAPARRPGLVALGMGGLVGAGAGMLAGGLFGAAVNDRASCEDCGLAGAVYGGLAGASLGIPLGVHLADRRRGNFSDVLAGSALAGTAVLLVAVESDRPGLVLAMPLAQLVTAMWLERQTTR